MKMTAKICMAALSFAAALAAAAAGDPTVPANEMATRLRELAAESGRLRLHALVAGADGEGIALVGDAPDSASLVRKGATLRVDIDGIRLDAAVSAVGPEGVWLDAGGTDPALLRGAYTPLPAPQGVCAPSLVRHLECDGVSVQTILRMIADRTGANSSVSEDAGKKTVGVFLRNIDAEGAVEEICRTANLWFRRDAAPGIIRVMTLEEYSGSLGTFREEATATFTLLYPNVIDVASAIYGLYPDRTLVSLGEDEFEEDAEYDLGRRFRRFRVLEENGGAQFMGMAAPQATASGSRSGSGVFSFSRGSAAGSLAQWDEIRRRARGGAAAGAAATIGYEDASLAEAAREAGDTNLVDRVRAQTVAAAANIFVSLSRKNNMLMVRTSDSRALDEIRALVKSLDVPVPMVLLELRVLELSLDDNYEASFTYSFNRGTHTIGHNGSGADNIFADIADAGRSAFNPSFAFKAVSDNITAQIKLLQQDGKIKTLATPTLLVANNEVARIFSGKQYPLVSGWRQGDTVVSESGIVQGTTTVEITKEDVGTMLLITPNINADKTVTLRLLQENSEVSPEKVSIPVNGSQGEAREIEYVESRSLAGTFIANDGMTVMAGGLVKETEGETNWRTPVLGSLPLVGWLFRGTEKIKERTELIVLIKPHVILTPYEGGRISRDVLDALSKNPDKSRP